MPTKGKSGDLAAYEEIYCKNVRPQVLRRLIVVWHQTTGKSNDRAKAIYALKPEDVMAIVGCSRRTAYDYILTLRNFV